MMTVQDVAKNVMKVTKTTQADVAAKAGLSGQGAVGMFLKSNSMRVDSLLTILNACGYELVARSADGRYPEFVIGDEIHTSEASEKNSDDMTEMIRRIVAEEVQKAVKKSK